MQKKVEKQIATLRDWGYEVSELDTGPVLYVESEFCTLYVNTDDAETLAALTDRDAHIERCQQMLETREETRERLAAEAEPGAHRPG